MTRLTAWKAVRPDLRTSHGYRHMAAALARLRAVTP